MSDTRKLVRSAYFDLKNGGQKPTVRAIQAYVLAVGGVSCSPNMVVDELAKIKEEGERISLKAADAVELPNPGEGQSIVVADPSTEELRVQLAAIAEILNLSKQENQELRTLVKRQSEALSNLNVYFAEQIKSMARDAMRDLVDARVSIQSEIDSLLKARESDKEQWDGMRKFLLQETERIRMAEQQRNQELKKKISDLEEMNLALTQAKNAAWEELGRLRLRLEDSQNARNR